MDAEKVAEAVRVADEALQKMMEKNGYHVYAGSGHGAEYARAVASLAGRVLVADTKKAK